MYDKTIRCDEQQCFLAQKIWRSFQINVKSINLVYQWKILLVYGMLVVLQSMHHDQIVAMHLVVALRLLRVAGIEIAITKCYLLAALLN